MDTLPSTTAYTPQPGSTLFAVDDETALVLLPSGSRLPLIGTYQFLVLAGIVSFAGGSISPSSTWSRVFAPTCFHVPSINYVSALPGSAIPGLVPEDLQLVVQEAQGTSCVILVRSLPTNINRVVAICHPFNDVFPVKERRELGIAGVSIPTPVECLPFSLPPSWEPSLLSFDSIKSDSPPVALVLGPKKTGKSAFARTLLNRMLTTHHRVAYLDCDLGQAEFTPGGVVSLHIAESPVFGPPFTHPSLSHTAHFLGSTSARDSPESYLSAIRHLTSVYREEVAFSFTDDDDDEGQTPSASNNSRTPPKSTLIPLVINTMGWTKGLGKDLLDQIIEISQPSDVISIQPPTYDAGAAAQTFSLATSSQVRVHEIEPMPPSPLSERYAAKDWRAISTLSYFYASFPTSSAPKSLIETTARDWIPPIPLSAHPPYEIDIEKAIDGVYLVGAGSEDVVPEEIGNALVGGLVGLVRHNAEGDEDAQMDLDGSNEQKQNRVPYAQGRPPPSPSDSECIGLAFIRAVDSTPANLHMLTPIPSTVLEQTNPRVLVKGTDPSFEMPIWGWLPLGGKEPADAVERPYLVWGKAEGVGATRRRVRRNLMRKGQM